MSRSGMQRIDAVLKKHESGLLEGAAVWFHWNDRYHDEPEDRISLAFNLKLN